MKRRRPAVFSTRAAGGGVDPSRAIRERAAFFLEAQDGPVSSEFLAREVLGLRRGSEAACAAILAPMLGPDPRFARTSEGRWVLGEPAPEPADVGEDARPLPERTWSVWSIEGEGRAAAVVRMEAGRIAGERAEPADSEALEDERLTPPGRRLRAAEAGAAPAVAGAPLSGPAWRRLREAAANALHVSWEAPSLVAEAIGLASSGSPVDPSASTEASWGSFGDAGAPPDVFSLASLARAALGAPRPRSIEHLATTLGLTFVEAADPLARARLGAACLAARSSPCLATRGSAPEGLRSRCRSHPSPSRCPAS